MEFTTEETAVFYRVLATMANVDKEVDRLEHQFFIQVMGELEISLYEKDLAKMLSREQIEQILKGMSQEKKIKIGQTAFQMMQMDGKIHAKEEEFYIYLLNVMGLLK